MNFRMAVRLAVKALKEQAQALSFDANMHDQYKADYPLAIQSSKNRANCLEAIRILQNSVKKGAENDR